MIFGKKWSFREGPSGTALGQAWERGRIFVFFLDFPVLGTYLLVLEQLNIAWENALYFFFGNGMEFFLLGWIFWEKWVFLGWASGDG